MMNEDIVSRIRKEVQFNGPNDTVQKDLLIRAADEIEKLRSLIVNYVRAQTNYDLFWEDDCNDNSEIEAEWRKRWSDIIDEFNRLVGLV